MRQFGGEQGGAEDDEFCMKDVDKFEEEEEAEVVETGLLSKCRASSSVYSAPQPPAVRVIRALQKQSSAPTLTQDAFFEETPDSSSSPVFHEMPFHSEDELNMRISWNRRASKRKCLRETSTKYAKPEDILCTSFCRVKQSPSVGSSTDKDVLALYKVHPKALEELSLLTDEPLYKVHKNESRTRRAATSAYRISDVKSDRGGSGHWNEDLLANHDVKQCYSDLEVNRKFSFECDEESEQERSFYIGASTSAVNLCLNSSDDYALSDLNCETYPIRVKAGVKRNRERVTNSPRKIVDCYFIALQNGLSSSDRYNFNDNLIWTICEFLPQEEVLSQLLYISKSWMRALRNFPLILDQGAVKSLLGKRAIRIGSHSRVLAQILRQWTVGFLCIRLKTRDTFDTLIREFPSLKYSLWGLVIKTKKKGRWTNPSEVEALSSLKCLQVLDIRCCEGLQSLSGILRNATHTLRRIDLSGCNNLLDVSILSACLGLESICLDNCEQLARIPDLQCTYLQSFLLGQCESLEALPDLSSSKNLRRLHLGNCSNLHSVSTFRLWTELREISMARCELFSDLSCMSNFLHLTTLDLAYCKQLKRVSGLRFCSELQHLSFDYCTKLRDISCLRYCVSLKSISFTYCKQLKDISPVVGCRDPACARSHTVDHNELSYFVSIERAQGVQAREIISSSTGWRLWSPKKDLSGDFRAWDTYFPSASSLLFSIPGIADRLPTLVERLQKTNFFANAQFDLGGCSRSLESVEIRRCRKMRNIESLIACTNLKRLSVHGCDSFPQVELDTPDSCEHLLRRQVNLTWSRFTS